MASTNKIVPSRTALLLLDLQVIYAKMDPSFEALMNHTASVITLARKHGITIAHCRGAITPSELAKIPDTNPTFSKLKYDSAHAALYDVDSPASAFHSAVKPEEGDLVFRKNRVGAFLGAADPVDVDKVFRERGIDTLILGGVSTGGAVAATIVQAADLDYRIFVVEDCCADPSKETHEFLMKFFEKRGSVIQSGGIEGLVE